MSAAIRTYRVAVDGYTHADYSARSPSKARARAWREFSTAFSKSFRDFLSISRVWRIPDPERIGERIMVAGLPATRCIGRGDHYVWFMRDNSDVLLCAHHLDVRQYRESDRCLGCTPDPVRP